MKVDPLFSGHVRLGILEMDGVRVGESPEELKSMIRAIASDVAVRYKGVSPGAIPAVREVRALFHRAGLDPTRYRPSSESLLRRAISGKGLYFINSAVDLVNYFSLSLLCPMGLYDSDHIRPPVEFRCGVAGESYEGIGRQSLNLDHFPLLADQEGPFGSPVSDSMRTRVAGNSSRILWITFAPPASRIPTEEFAAMMARFNGGFIRMAMQV
jgi:DNA/RNA-binding domain of Phe-tRNA-synthetase-like protein